MTTSHPRAGANRRRLLGTGATVTAAVLGAGLLAGAPAHAADDVTINLVTINDLHGRIESSSPAGGMAAITTAVEQVRAANPNTIFASAGDNIGASTFTSFIQQDAPTIDALNVAGLDVSAAGNHEFDLGFADLRDRVIPRAQFSHLGANVYYDDGTRALEPYEIVTVAGDVDVAFVGAVTEEMPSLVSPAGIAGIEFRDIASEVNIAADAALADGAEIVIALVHEGGSSDPADAADPTTPLGDIVTGLDGDIDMLVTSHTHATYAYDVDDLRVTQAGQYGERLQNTAITYDRESGDVSFATTETISMWNTSVSPAVRNVTPDLDNPVVAAVDSIVSEAVAYAQAEGGVPLGDITADLRRERQPRTPTADNPSTTEEARGAESTLGNFVADVQLWAAQQRFSDVQIAFMNPGGLRADLAYASSGANDPDGNVTYAEAAAVQPFANTLVTMSLTGEQIAALLEEQWQPAAASRPFLKLGVSDGLTYVTDYAAAAGSRVTNLRLDDQPVDPAATYRIVTNSFLASGGDNFGTFAAGTARADSGLIDLSAMVDYLDANSPAAPDLAQRSIGVSLSAPAAATGYAPGESITIDLASLDFTQTSVAAETVAVSIGGVDVGSAAIDRSLVRLTDEAGQASLDVVVPEGLTGEVALRITTPAGTDFTLPIVVAEPDTTAPTVTVKPESQGADGVFRSVSFKLFDEGKIDRLTLNGVEKDLTDNRWSDLNSVTPGRFGAVAGANTLLVYDVAGNVTTVEFVLDVTAPTVTVKQGANFTVGTPADGYEKVSFKLFDAYEIDRLTLNGVEKNLSDNRWSDLNFVRPGAFGGIVGTNELKVYDVLGNVTTVTFELRNP
ncbi:5'-nucleotidase C-terminal domain-containing protein [Microbacterium koreense]|uniref:5'-nucleotidase C-terminal domain-containing protein n=1 Tax=Microbacterium koreense TaxID=323761 RepID=A0ABW2ZTE3_9MICO